MKHYVGLIAIVLLSSLFNLNAQEAATLEINRIVFGTAIEDRQPANVDTVFAADVERIFCLTEISGASDTTNITHVWYLNGKEKARVDLKVKSKRWRTWSSKRIPEEWDGKWRVDVVDMNGKVLKSSSFVVKSSGA